MDDLIELVVDLYGEIVFGLIPKEGLSRRALVGIKVVAAVIFLAMISLLAVGSYYLFEEGRMIGLLPIGIAVALLLAHIIVFLIFKLRKRR